MTNEAIGNIKQGVGDLTNDASLKREGELQEKKGEAQYIKGDVEGATGDHI
ncbi:CsbD family protein [Glacieibacterium frigidum]|uniref:CsbD family protein n=2 Tax=Glacieibacterium frigidum TaxID=2593303 RepID=A0A552UJP2_9SPHN|nr:CsbD family protein [Glacieibacterium frigidum]